MQKSFVAPPSFPVRWTILLLVFLAPVLSVASIPPGDVHAAPQPGLSRAAASIEHCAALPGHAILPAIPLWKARLRTQLVRIEVSATTIPSGYRQRPTSRAPPIPFP
jgi:hypothetical protein